MFIVATFQTKDAKSIHLKNLLKPVDGDQNNKSILELIVEEHREKLSKLKALEIKKMKNDVLVDTSTIDTLQDKKKKEPFYNVCSMVNKQIKESDFKKLTSKTIEQQNTIYCINPRVETLRRYFESLIESNENKSELNKKVEKFQAKKSQSTTKKINVSSENPLLLKVSFKKLPEVQMVKKNFYPTINDTKMKLKKHNKIDGKSERNIEALPKIKTIEIDSINYINDEKFPKKEKNSFLKRLNFKNKFFFPKKNKLRDNKVDSIQQKNSVILNNFSSLSLKDLVDYLQPLYLEK